MKWSTVTGSDFGRSIKWARSQTNKITEAIRQKMTQLDIAFDRAEVAANRSADRAERANAGWKDSAYAYFVEYAKAEWQHGGEFTTEDVRQWATDLPEPPDARAWGQVALRAMRSGVVTKAGYRAVASSNGSAKVLWRVKR